MKITKAATSVIEAMVIMLIIVTWVVGMYNIYNESVRLSDLTAQRLQAIEIAREWVEAVENIRNTNWILYASDYGNCWNTINYDNNCIGFDSTAPISATNINTDIVPGSYILYQHPVQKRWFLESQGSNSSFDQNYRNTFEIFRWDDDWFYTQSGSNNTTHTKSSLAPIFTREIVIWYPGWDSNSSEMNITSIVKWDGRGDKTHTIEIDLTLTNWKNDN